MENSEQFEPISNSDGKHFREALNAQLKDLYDRLQLHMDDPRPFEPIPNSDGKHFREALNARLKDIHDQLQKLEGKVAKEQA